MQKPTIVSCQLHIMPNDVMQRSMGHVRRPNLHSTIHLNKVVSLIQTVQQPISLFPDPIEDFPPHEFKYLATAPLNLLPPSPATLMIFSRSSPAVIPIFLMKSLATVSRSSPPAPPSGRSSSGLPKYAFEEMDVAPSNPCRRVLASAWAVGSKALRPKNSSEEMPFCVPNFWRA